MIRTLLLMCALAVLAPVAQAQEGGDARGALRDEFKKELESNRDAHRKKVDETASKNRAAIDALRDECRSKVDAAATPDERESVHRACRDKVQAMKQQMKQERKALRDERKSSHQAMKEKFKAKRDDMRQAPTEGAPE